MLREKLKAFRAGWAAHRRSKQTNGDLELLILFITNHCNMRCGHCFFASHLNNGTQDMPLERIQQLFASLPTIREETVITGGEPFLHRNLGAIVRTAHDSPATRFIQIDTNGYFSDRIEDLSKDLVSWNRKKVTVQISLDGLEETHDAIRGVRGAFQQAMETADRLIRLTRFEPGFFSPVFLMVINHRNYRQIRPLADLIHSQFGRSLAFELVRGIDFSAWQIPPELASEDFNPPELLLPPETAWDEIYQQVQALNRQHGYPYQHFCSKLKYQFQMLRQRQPVVPCVAPQGKTPVIYANGDVATCEFARPFANLGEFDNNFKALWGSPQAIQNRQGLSSCFCTHACFLVPSMVRNRALTWRLLKDL